MEGQQKQLQKRSAEQSEATSMGDSSSKTESSLFESMRKRVLGDGQSPAQSDHGRQFWMPDSRAKTCYDCGATFNALRRRHHCRICGQVFCHRCSPHMMDPKMYKACTGSDTATSVRVCRYCYRVTLKNELPTSPDHHSLRHRAEASSASSSAGKERPVEKQGTAVTAKDEPSGSSLNSWFFNSTFGRRISTSASLASIGDIVRSTITPANVERKPSLSRPVSASSDSDRRFSLVNSPTDGLGSSSNLVSASSYDNLRTIISEVNERIDDDYNKPNWVKEILENVKKRQLDQLEAEQMEEGLEFVDEVNTQDQFRFAEEDEDNLSIEHPDSAARVKFNSTAESVSVGYNYQMPTRVLLKGDRPGSAKARPSPVDFNGQSFDSSNGSVASEATSHFDFVNKMFYGTEKDTHQELMPSAEIPSFEVSPDESFSQTALAPEDLASSLLEAIYDRHCNRILQQALLDEKLSLDWMPVLADLSKRIANSIILAHHSYLSSIDNYYMDSLEMRQGLRRHTVSTLRCGNTFFPMDIRQRVKIKGIQGGSKADCAIVHGVVFTKNVAHRKMRTDITNARLLLFACSIGYDERKRALATTTSTSAILKLTSLDSMRLQEHSYVANLVAKIASSGPDVIFVCGSVSSSALELLHEKYHITVVLNVKRSILDRIALFTGTTVIQSPEILNQTRIGTCGRFRLQKFAISSAASAAAAAAYEGQQRPVASPMTKTLMFIEGCLPTVGCSVLLRGTPRFAEFRALKSVLGYLVYVQYNARLERAYHLNLNCIPIDSSQQQQPKSAGELLATLLGTPRTRARISSSRSRTLAEDSVVLSVMPSADGPQQQPNDDVSATTTPTIKSPKAAVPKLTEISDNSDPLRSSAAEAATLTLDDDDEEENRETRKTTAKNGNTASNNKLTTVQLTEIISRSFETLLTALPLSSSPAIEFPVPYLMEANIHGQSSLRHYYPPNLITSERLSVLTTAELERRRAANEIYENNRSEGGEHFEKDDDYANYVYLRAHYAAIKRDWPALTEAVARKEEAKLRPLEALLQRRYMLEKPHPLLLNSDHQQHCGRQGANSRQLVADFRAHGPYLRCIPTIASRAQPRGALKGVAKDVALATAVEPPVEPLSSIDQERLSVLFSVFSPQSKNAPNYCFKPTTLDIAYYGRNDMSLGAFLFRHFFFLRSRFNQTVNSGSSVAADDGTSFSSSSSLGGGGGGGGIGSGSAPIGSSVSRRIFCSSETCNASMFRHLVRFSHHRGTITVLLSKIQDTQKSMPMPHRVLTWTFCVLCRAKSSNAEMSADALALSFGKFLELKFYGDRHYYYGRYFDRALPCKHSLHKDAYHFFSYDLLVVSFKYDPIVLYEVVTPAPIIVTTRNQFSKLELINYLQDLTIRGHEVFAKVGEEIERLREAITVKVNAQANGGGGGGGGGGSTVALPTTLSGLNFESTDLAHVEEWTVRLRTEEADFVAAIKESHIAISSSETVNSLPVLELFRMQNRVIRTKKAVVEVVAAWNDRLNDFITARKRNPDKLITSLMNRILPSDKQQKEQPDTMSNKSFDLDKPDSGDQQTVQTGTVSGLSPSSLSNSQENLLEVSPTASRLTSLTSKVISKVSSKTASNAGASEGGGENGPPATSFAARFLSGRLAVDEAFFSIGNPFESTFAREYAMFEHFQLPTFKDISIIVRDKDLGSIIAYAMTTPEYERKLADLRPPATSQQHFKRLSSVDGILDKSTENYVDGSAMSVPSKTEQSEIASSVKSGTVSGAELSQHIDVQYNDAFAKFYCCVYFAEHFRRLRSAVLTDGDASNRETVRRLLPSGEQESSFVSSAAEELYIHSIANCIPWNAIGGKSGSTFSKTQNQRFILKEVSKGELNHFITFARDYVAYVERALLEKRPSAFVKIIGVYQISYKNSCTNKASVHHILVMENLFYECNISFIYDLKGSMRNRKVEINVAAAADAEMSTGGEETSANGNSASVDQATGSSNSRGNNVHDEAKLYQNNHAQTSTVLMDENLRLISTVYPLYVHPHSKRLLMEAIFRDSEFLRAHVVMDYSLLVGFDDQYSEYAVGIIDYVRLFNWEKEIEFRVKKLGKTIDPTIVHPSQYQRRFLDAINEYFVDVPDKWAPYMPLVPLAGMRIGGGVGGHDGETASGGDHLNGAISADNQQGSSTDDVIL